VDRKKKGLI